MAKEIRVWIEKDKSLEDLWMDWLYIARKKYGCKTRAEALRKAIELAMESTKVRYV